MLEKIVPKKRCSVLSGAWIRFVNFILMSNRQLKNVFHFVTVIILHFPFFLFYFLHKVKNFINIFPDNAQGD